MKRLLLTIVVLGALAVCICRIKGVTFADVRAFMRNAERTILGEGESKKTPSGFVGEFADEFAQAVEAALPGADAQEAVEEQIRELRKRLAAREEAIQLANSKLSPYITEAVRLKRAYDAAVKKIDNVKEQYGQTSAEMTVAYQNMVAVKDKLETANRKHREWKERNRSRLADPEKDPEIIEIKDALRALGVPL
ncbi:MAG: hypothetical protein IJ802_05770 [Kiritimatiellae bacterium]|nr:hypothetical protein [Kiritimatiellia bacterium]